MFGGVLGCFPVASIAITFHSVSVENSVQRSSGLVYPRHSTHPIFQYVHFSYEARHAAFRELPVLSHQSATETHALHASGYRELDIKSRDGWHHPEL